MTRPKIKYERIDSIDQDASIKNVRSFFKKHGKHQISRFDKLMQQAGSSSDDLKSVIWSDMPKGGHADNSQEIKLERSIDARTEFAVYLQVFKEMNTLYRKIFIDYFISNEFHDMKWTNICTILNLASRQRANEIMDRAMLQLAIRYGYHQGFRVETFLVLSGADKVSTNPVQTLDIV
ncbi:putative phage autolysin regulatory protein ArpU [Oenococcus oeni]|uniref:hypothetical protein n=1 Tax=Oenococcus oeni TaxID=1247 RepID=UPI00107CA6C2|nr:hypothetical protein [Oenococcus oeni]AVI94089.1 hypothetical protein AX764_04245 [Oenococcus oeni]SYV99715.1 putative phage autolysin regulatory protein ArpU [Oenococcus oeni]SYW03893.1 putative phage autolysin regulatory protein ArpU [Oenococcus oeni]SYW17669.1 putative phage autolysin regulatory protein ArpU [Oenococcus oeni]VDC14606.1 putative phage autolysin regulatory protein ArpU [Oenococcus oeni]